MALYAIAGLKMISSVELLRADIESLERLLAERKQIPQHHRIRQLRRRTVRQIENAEILPVAVRVKVLV